MKTSLLATAALIALSTTAFAQRPSVYPLRSQTGAAQGVDNAYCYWQAKQQTGVDMARQPQRPVRTTPLRFASAADAGAGASEPPLPGPRGTPGGLPGAANPGSPAAGTGSTSAASHAPPGAAVSSASASASSGAAQAAAPVSGTASASSRMASASSGAASGATPNLPPLPPPEPPMTTYWQAYGDCMQSRGYGVQ
ncbi:hypothetical protein [Trinickia dinghuensis]|uniref:Uncharacterized protein n=1 Tax=Trinickia dinghuensis TaxID=2291023 RepID=A0A3D8JP50_9BURK|nr:hypothetical protein [Trinickia dinghuensis]RDU94660.1 hypothetical protein DWV00_32655 [Trinickia dinghuensis]